VLAWQAGQQHKVTPSTGLELQGENSRSELHWQWQRLCIVLLLRVACSDFSLGRKSMIWPQWLDPATLVLVQGTLPGGVIFGEPFL
jgi:hypothetical protein